MSLSVDQFMQVKCKFQLTSETESSESIHSNSEQVRLCTSVDFDKNSTLIVMICSNETCNNHILAYYIERRVHNSTPSISDNSLAFNSITKQSATTSTSQQQQQQQSLFNTSNSNNYTDGSITFSQLAQQSTPPRSPRNGITHHKNRFKPRIIVKQIYYHNYNEDIVAICLSETGNKLTLVSASATVYILPIKNILLNLHAQQLRSSQGKSMYFYDASILNCSSIENPVAVAYWESAESNRSYVIVAGQQGELSFSSVDDKKEINMNNVHEPIRYLSIIRDKFSHSLLITCASFNQYRLTLELVKHQHDSSSPEIIQTSPTFAIQTTVFMPPDLEPPISLEKDLTPSWDKKPIPIKLHSNFGSSYSAAAVLQRVFVPSSRFGNQSNLLSQYSPRERSLPLIFNHSSNLISVVDVLGVSCNRFQQSVNVQRQQIVEPRLLRFYSTKHYYYRPQKPLLVCKLHLMDPDEMIIHIVLTDRFVAITTDRDRCLINSRNCCNLRNSNSSIELDPLVKEITFNNEERIMLLVKSPVSNDQDNIVESFLLVTTRSIYSIEARQSCREMFINLIDTHLAIKPARQSTINRQIFASESFIPSGFNLNEFTLVENHRDQRKYSESNLLINSFLCHRDEVYERICYDARAFSILFKLELNSLFEAYGDGLLQRKQFELANRFFQMAKFDHTKTLGKYIRLGAYKQTIDYIIGVLTDENEILDEKERIDLSKAAFECLLAKTIVERGKSTIYNVKLRRNRLKRLIEYHDSKIAPSKDSPFKRFIGLRRSTLKNPLDPFELCEHSPRGHEAKLSATTIIVDPIMNDGDEATLTSNSSEAPQVEVDKTVRDMRLECEKSLIEFIKNLMPISLYNYAMSQLIAFDLIELVNILACSNAHIYSLLKMLIRAKDEDRMIFRDKRFKALADKLISLNKKDLVKIDTSKHEFLEFITSPDVTKALVRDISLTCEYLGYQHTIMQFRKYSFAALRQLETYLRLVNCRQKQLQQRRHQKQRRSSFKIHLNDDADDDSANDGICFAIVENNNNKLMTKHQKQTLENIFIEFLNACLDESTDESCRLWFNYINFYLNNVGSLEELENDILNLIDSNPGDCRLPITLYKAIYRDEILLNGGGNDSAANMLSKQSIMSDNVTYLPESMKRLYNLAKLFRNEFLMRLLEKTLDMVPQAADLDAISLVAMC